MGGGRPASGKGRVSSGMWTRISERDGEEVFEEKDSEGDKE